MTINPGPGVDAQGRIAIDPTANVIALTDAAVKRLDDLRDKDMNHIKELVELRAEYDEKLREAESKRIDAIRSVDVSAVTRAAEVATTQAQTLAAQVSTVTDMLRTQISTTAAAQDSKLATALAPLNTAIADLRRAQYEAQGQKTQVVESRNTSVALYTLIGLMVTLLMAMLTI